jgi:hypothetical protein
MLKRRAWGTYCIAVAGAPIFGLAVPRSLWLSGEPSYDHSLTILVLHGFRVPTTCPTLARDALIGEQRSAATISDSVEGCRL